jgi:hypothetical protein
MYDLDNENIGEVISKLEQVVTDNKEHMELADCLSRLEKNPDFIKVVVNGYFIDAAVRLVAFKGSQACIGQSEIDADKDITAIGKFRNYLSSIRRNADIAQQSTNDCLEQIAELHKQSEEM